MASHYSLDMVKKNFGIFWGLLLGSKTKGVKTCFVKKFCQKP